MKKEKHTLDISNKYSVFVGAVEVNDYSLSHEQAERLAFEYELDGYDDVQIIKVGYRLDLDYNSTIFRPWKQYTRNRIEHIQT